MINRELIEEILKDISTPTGLSYSGDQTIANSTVENILEFIDELKEEKDHYKHLYSEVKKQKDDGIDWIKNNYCYVGKKMTLKPFSDLKDLLRMLGEIDENR